MCLGMGRMSIRLAICAVFLAITVIGCKKQIAGGKADGQAIFADACARCHGSDGSPDEAMVSGMGVKDLTTAEFRARATADFVRHRVSNGSDNRVMPPFANQLTPEQLDAVVAYVLTLSAP